MVYAHGKLRAVTLGASGKLQGWPEGFASIQHDDRIAVTAPGHSNLNHGPIADSTFDDSEIHGDGTRGDDLIHGQRGLAGDSTENHNLGKDRRGAGAKTGIAGVAGDNGVRARAQRGDAEAGLSGVVQCAASQHRVALSKIDCT